MSEIKMDKTPLMCDVCGTFFEHILPEPECPKCGGETHRATQEDV